LADWPQTAWVIGEIRDSQLTLSAGTLTTKPRMASGFIQ